MIGLIDAWFLLYARYIVRLAGRLGIWWAKLLPWWVLVAIVIATLPGHIDEDWPINFFVTVLMVVMMYPGAMRHAHVLLAMQSAIDLLGAEASIWTLPAYRKERVKEMLLSLVVAVGFTVIDFDNITWMKWMLIPKLLMPVYLWPYFIQIGLEGQLSAFSRRPIPRVIDAIPK